jgi:ABC-type methionine transport system ATPase subunit
MTLSTNDQRQAQKRLRIRIPKQYHQDPILSRLVSQHSLSVNILAAMLGANANGDGWFDIELRGNQSQIDNALTDLGDLDLEIWPETETDGW